MKLIAGTAEILAELAKQRDKLVAAVAEATEQTAVQVSVHAASDHTTGFGHAVGRYENQTTTLTRSLLQSPKPVKVAPDEVIYSVGSNVEYAAPVEMAYPYLWPALVAHQDKFKGNIRGALGL